MSGHAIRPQQEAGTDDCPRVSLGEASWRRHACPGPSLRTKPAAKSGELAATVLERNAHFAWRLERLRARPDSGVAAVVSADWALRRYRRGWDDVGDTGEAALSGLAQHNADAHGTWTPGAADHGAAELGTVADGTAAQGAAASVTAPHRAGAHGEAAYGAPAYGTEAHGTGAPGEVEHSAPIHGTAAQGAAVQGTVAHGTAAHGTATHATAAHGTATHATAAHDPAAHGMTAHDTVRPAAATPPADKPASPASTDPASGDAAGIAGQGHASLSAAPSVGAAAPAGPGMRAGLYGSIPGMGTVVQVGGPAFHAALVARAFRSAASRSMPAAGAPSGAATGAAAALNDSAAPFNFPLAARVLSAVSARWGTPPAWEQQAISRLPAGPLWTSVFAGTGSPQSMLGAATASDPGALLPATYRLSPPAGIVTAVVVAANLSRNSAAAAQEAAYPGPRAIRVADAMGASAAAEAEADWAESLPLNGRSSDRAGDSAAASSQTAGLVNVVGIAPTALDASASKRLALAMALDSVHRPQHLQAVRRLQALRGQPGVHTPAAGSIFRPIAVRAGLAPLQRSVEARWPALAPLITVARSAIAGNPRQEHAGGAHAMRVPGQGVDGAELPHAYGFGAGTPAAVLASGAAGAAWNDGGSSWTRPGPGGQGAALILPAGIPAAIAAALSGETPDAIPAAIPPAIPPATPDSIPGAMSPAIPDSIPGAAARVPGYVSDGNSAPGLDADGEAGPPAPPLIAGEVAEAPLWRARIRLARTPLPGKRRQIAVAPQLFMPHPTGGSNGASRPSAASRVGDAVPLPLATVSRRAWPSDAPALAAAPTPASAGATSAHRVQPPPPVPPAWPGDTHPGPTAHAIGGWTDADRVATSHGVVPVSLEAGAAWQGPSRPHAVAGTELDLEQLSEHIWQSIMDKLVVEQERRGAGKWP